MSSTCIPKFSIPSSAPASLTRPWWIAAISSIDLTVYPLISSSVRLLRWTGSEITFARPPSHRSCVLTWRRGGPILGEQPLGPRALDRHDPVGRVELAQDRGHVVRDGSGGEMKPGGDRGVGLAAGHPAEHLLLAAGEARGVGEGGRPRAARRAGAAVGALALERDHRGVGAQVVQRVQRVASRALVSGKGREGGFVRRFQVAPGS